MKKLILLLTLVWTCELSFSQWNYSWATRTDVDGKPAGIYTTTPFPIIENSTTYSITTDEGTTVYNLGTLYFVDGAKADDTGDGLSLANAKKTISAAITAAGTGNKTIIVRGAHDSFNGIYYGTYSLYGCYGTDNTHRFTITGYGQERPVLDGGNTTDSIIRRSDGTNRNAYITVQRLKLTNTQASGVRLGWDVADDKRDSYFNCIDVWFYSCGNNLSYLTDGNCYWLNADYGFISHCLFERSIGHGVKIGDGASYCVLEWSISRENGWWPGKTTFYSRTVAIDFPSDRDTSIANIVRYNIGYGCVSHGLQLRRQKNVVVHHNEIYDFGHGYSMTGNMGGVTPVGLYLFAGSSGGTIYSNIVRNPAASPTTKSLLLGTDILSPNTATVFNNLLYGGETYAIYTEYGNTGTVEFYNNTIYSTTASGTTLIWDRAGSNTFKNNIIHQLSTGSCASYQAGVTVHTNNLYYYPLGTIGTNVGAETGMVDAQDPLFVSVSSGAYADGNFSIGASSPAYNAGATLASAFEVSFNGMTRITWDIGEWEYSAGETTTTSSTTTSTSSTSSTATSTTTIETTTSSTSTSSTSTSSTSSTSSTTTTLPDLTISAVVATPLNSSMVLVTWTTDVVANTVVRYGLTNTYERGGFVNYNNSVTSHSIAAHGLLPGITYHYRVESEGTVSGITTYGADGMFSTPGTGRARLRKP